MDLGFGLSVIYPHRSIVEEENKNGVILFVVLLYMNVHFYPSRAKM